MLERQFGPIIDSITVSSFTGMVLLSVKHRTRVRLRREGWLVSDTQQVLSPVGHRSRTVDL